MTGDADFTLSPGLLMAASFVAFAPPLAALSMGLRALRARGRGRMLAAIGAALALACVPLGLFFLPGGDRLALAAFHALLAAVALAWIACLWRMRGNRWLDAAVIVGPALAGLLLVLTEHR
ncbi:hypothetical protein HMH01_15720 [Halovulum dunhuangense]|uniref:Uncharacterized protein n=1 Tax=Halovulum dunhuangense TaxID=1505036 RepID=A0A849L637_9RHOB|nr:hypothetical protein [Halovulum dunhuangense]NNU81885.1 hypothetical protein [Halovulum dunhuangense]